MVLMMSKHTTVAITLLALVMPVEASRAQQETAPRTSDIQGLEVSRFAAPEAKAVIICLHDIYSNRAAFSGLAVRLEQSGMVIYITDLRGFGRWWRNQNSEIDFQKSIKDVLQIVKDAEVRYPQRPIFLLGEGIGALIALQVIQNKVAINGLILSSPALPKKSILKDERFRATYTPSMRYVKKCLFRPQGVSQRVLDRVAERNTFLGPSVDQLTISKIEALALKATALENIDIPTIVFVGERDEVSDLASIHRTIAAAKRCEVARENCGRFIFEFGELLTSHRAPLLHSTEVLRDWISKNSDIFD